MEWQQLPVRLPSKGSPDTRLSGWSRELTTQAGGLFVCLAQSTEGGQKARKAVRGGKAQAVPPRPLARAQPWASPFPFPAHPVCAAGQQAAGSTAPGSRPTRHPRHCPCSSHDSHVRRWAACTAAVTPETPQPLFSPRQPPF